MDIDPASPNFGRWVGLTLSAADWNQVFIPAGFAHGFLTLEPDTEIQYKVSRPYDPALDRTIRYDDPEIGIDWPLAPDALILSDKDRAAPTLRAFLAGDPRPSPAA